MFPTASRSGTSSPLPSFSSPSGLSSLTASDFAPAPGGAVAEKRALSSSASYHHRVRGGVREWIVPRRVGELFRPLQLRFGGRVVTVPVLKVLHPAWELRGSLSRRGGGGGGGGADGRAHGHAQSTPGIHIHGPGSSAAISAYSFGRTLVALFGTALALLFSFLFLLALVRPLLPSRRSLPFQGEPNTLVLSPAEVERVWLWEIAAGRYPSQRKVGVDLLASGGGGGGGGGAGTRTKYAVGAGGAKVENPGVPRRTEEDIRREKEVQAEVTKRLREQAGAGPAAAAPNVVGADVLVRSDAATVVPVGPARTYVPIQPRKPFTHRAGASPPPALYPARPQPNAAIDLDAVMDHCDFSESKYVRDCLEVLRMNAGLDTGVRRGDANAWRTTFVAGVGGGSGVGTSERLMLERTSGNMTALLNATAFPALLATRQQLTLSPPVFPRVRHSSHPTADVGCDPDYPRIFHIFWAGPFTDKPYSAALSFLYTQRLALHLPVQTTQPAKVCRPQLWIWINPGPASSLPDPRARQTMLDDLADNPWSAPLLHERFAEAVKFRLWNTTEQLDGVQEMKGWREMRLFNSGGVKYGSEVKPSAVKKEAPPLVSPIITDESDTSEDMVAEAELGRIRNETMNATLTDSPPPPKAKDELFERVGSSSSKGYDRLSVVLSDMARFVLTHRFGGVYLDADTILLRDWEELWGWHGAFAYRWSRLEKYNTAVLKMQRGSAIGNLIFRTAVANGLDFHPMTVSRYTKDAGVEGLLLRLPDALFDPAWLNTEYYQRDRPPFPYFKRFEDFFDTPKDSNGAPAALGFDGFFKGAFSYHFHNFWWIPFDPSRNFPDLGPRFSAGERVARGRLLAAKLAALPSSLRAASLTGTDLNAPSPTLPETAPTGAVPVQNIVGPTGAIHRAGAGKVVPKWGDDERDFDELDWSAESAEEDERDLSWAAVLKRTFEQYLRGEAPNMYGEWIDWDTRGKDDDRDW